LENVQGKNLERAGEVERGKGRFKAFYKPFPKMGAALNGMNHKFFHPAEALILSMYSEYNTC
jgi:hypothetical protein